MEGLTAAEQMHVSNVLARASMRKASLDTQLMHRIGSASSSQWELTLQENDQLSKTVQSDLHGRSADSYQQHEISSAADISQIKQLQRDFDMVYERSGYVEKSCTDPELGWSEQSGSQIWSARIESAEASAEVDVSDRCHYPFGK